MSPEERELHVEEMQWRREELRTRIADLSAKRRLYVASQMAAKGLDDSRAFDTVVREALRGTLEENGFRVRER